MKNIALTQFYDTLLCIPGMHDVVKIDFRISRKSILVLSQMLEQGIQVKGKNSETEFAPLISPEVVKEIREVLDCCLEKSQLTPLAQQLKHLHEQSADGNAQ